MYNEEKVFKDDITTLSKVWGDLSEDMQKVLSMAIAGRKSKEVLNIIMKSTSDTKPEIEFTSGYADSTNGCSSKCKTAVTSTFDHNIIKKIAEDVSKVIWNNDIK